VRRCEALSLQPLTDSVGDFPISTAMASAGASGLASSQSIRRPALWPGSRCERETFLEVLATVDAVTSFTDKPSRACRPTPLCGLQLFAAIATSPPPPWTVERSPGTNSYAFTSAGIRVAVFCTKLHCRLLRPLLEPDQPPSPVELRRALGSIDQVLGDSRDRGSGQRPGTCHRVVQRLEDQERSSSRVLP
jgi:hypothetical protein